MEMTEELFWSVRRSATFSATASEAAAFVSCMIVALAVALVFGELVWGSHEWVLILFRAVFLRRFHREHKLRVFVLVIPVVFFSLPHYPSLFDPPSMVASDLAYFSASAYRSVSVLGGSLDR